MGKKNKKNKHDKNKNQRAEESIEKEQNDNEEVSEEPNTDDKEVEEPVKRQHADDDSDEEDNKPKRKKKKKPIVPEDSDNKKGKKSIRQMKREKLAQRQAEAQAASKDQLKSQCVTYLSQWKHDKSNWKFMKAKQVWLFKNKFSSHLVPESSWQTLLEYFESAKGNIRNMLLDDAKKVIAKMDEWIESQKGQESKENENDDEEEVETDSNKPDDTTYKRARDLIQCLEE